MTSKRKKEIKAGDIFVAKKTGPWILQGYCCLVLSVIDSKRIPGDRHYKVYSFDFKEVGFCSRNWLENEKCMERLENVDARTLERASL
jgi:hypothetical protein